MKSTSQRFVLLGLAAFACATSSFAQYQTNTALYPTSANPGSMRYGGQNATNNPLLPSQARQEVVQSGLTPSQLRGNAMAAGPLAEGGVAAIVPGGTQLERATGQSGGGGGSGSVRPAPAATGSMRYNQPMSQPPPDLRIGGPISPGPIR